MSTQSSGKQSRTTVIVLTVTFVLLFLAAIGLLVFEIGKAAEGYLALTETPHVGFAAADNDRPFEYSDDVEALAEYHSMYDYNDRIYYRLLSDEEKQLYHYYEYAMDNGYSFIRVNRELLSPDTPATKVLDYLSLDSAFLEQNLYSVGVMPVTDTHTFDWWLDLPAIEALRQYEVVNFSKTKLEQKQQAVAEAKKIVAAMPNGLTDMEKALYFYRYLGENVEYVDVENVGDACYLYDALCVKKTNCDGYSNAYALLCQMVDIPCFEKKYESNEEGVDGHTWVCVQIDGAWYNVDPTASVEVLQDDIVGEALHYFCFSDSRQQYTPTYGELLPACETDRNAFDLKFRSVHDNGFVSGVGKALKKKQGFLTVSLDNLYEPEDYEPVLQKICDQYALDITYVTHKTIYGKYILYISCER